MPKMVKPASPERFWRVNELTHKSLHPYVTAIGQASVAWNALQEELGGLFAMIVGIEAGGDKGITSTIWHTIDNDRTQRKLLLAASQRIHAFGKITDTAFEEIKWLKVEADKLSDARNDAIHSPLRSRTNYGE